MRFGCKALLAAALIASAAPAAAQSGDKENPAGDWRHAPSGVVFPKSFGHFAREKIHQFDDTGQDVSTTYFRRADDDKLGLVAIYVYPARSSDCASIWAGEKTESLGTAGVLVSEDRLPSPSGKTAGAAYHARVQLPLGQDKPDPAISSSIYLYCAPGGKWLVKYYSSWRNAGPEFENEVVALLRSIRWPAPLDR